MLNLIMSLVLGAGLDSLYYFMYISKLKNINKHKTIFYLAILIGYIILYMVLQYRLYLYLIFYVYIYILLKLIAKSQINDFFITIFLDLYFISLSILCYFMIPNYVIALIIDKILLFAPLVFISKIKTLYNKYCKFWNRNRDKKMPIKSLTLRNISLVVLNIIIVALNFLLIYLINLG